MFDSLHTGTHCAQVKCLGKGLADLRPGDTASLVRSATDAELAAHPEPPSPPQHPTPEQWAAWSDAPHTRLAYGGVARPEVVSWQVAGDDGLFVTFTDGVFVGIDDVRRDDHVLVDNGGHDVAEGQEVSRPAWISSPDGCEFCAAQTALAELFAAVVTAEVAAELLGVDGAGFAAMVGERQVVVVPTAGADPVIPLAQFTVDGDRVLPAAGLAEVLGPLDAPDELAALRWLGWPNRRLDGATPWESLAAAGATAELVAAAAAQHDAWVGIRG